MTLLEDIARAICLSDSDSAPYSCECISRVECTDTLAAARAVLAAIEASGTHVVVPTEATREMLYEFNIHRADSLDQYGWNDIISARPKVT